MTAAPVLAAERLPLSEARDRLADLLRDAGRGGRRVVLTGEDGTPVGALVPMEDLATLEALEAAEDREDAALFQEAMAEWRAGGCQTISLDEFARKHGIDLRASDD